MTPHRCPHGDSLTLTFSGWAQIDHCANCGRILGDAVTPRAALDARRRFRKASTDFLDSPRSSPFNIDGDPRQPRGVEEATG